MDSQIASPEFGSDHVGSDHNEMTVARAAELAKDGIRDILSEQAKIDAIMQEAKDKCAPHRDAMKSTRKQIREETNCPADVLSAAITLLRTEQRHEKRVDKFDETSSEFWLQLEMQLAA